eukprot:6200684-Pleurochrysis_carterae.AAC.1
MPSCCAGRSSDMQGKDPDSRRGYITGEGDISDLGVQKESSDGRPKIEQMMRTSWNCQACGMSIRMKRLLQTRAPCWSGCGSRGAGTTASSVREATSFSPRLASAFHREIQNKELDNS